MFIVITAKRILTVAVKLKENIRDSMSRKLAGHSGWMGDRKGAGIKVTSGFQDQTYEKLIIMNRKQKTKMRNQLGNEVIDEFILTG